mmetsp:Transcript_23574/g.3895  ORF Transcript_23574/g.3895 Transcript_23574/m.3895 type:complete len:80 (-) Transcript_23574:1602-1841(-)
MRGEAGVFRGGASNRVQIGPKGVTFQFKSTSYKGDDVKNGENADDGPIFDVYYQMGIEQNIEEYEFERFDQYGGEWRIG